MIFYLCDLYLYDLYLYGLYLYKLYLYDLYLFNLHLYDLYLFNLYLYDRICSRPTLAPQINRLLSQALKNQTPPCQPRMHTPENSAPKMHTIKGFSLHNERVLITQ